MTENEILIKTREVLEAMTRLIDDSNWKNEYGLSLKTLEEELNAPCVLAVAGKVKAGKSFLINSLLGIDLAMTGTTETTATINVFKKGKPFSPDKPVLCQWMNGKKEWMGKDFLDKLQGTDSATLEITAQIDKLIFYVEDNVLLEDVTLVDTPGIGADVGDDGDAHEEQTDAYFNLRNRHNDATVSLSNSADAIIYLFNTVPTETDQTFLTALYDGGHGITALNGIGVLSKIDKNLDQLNNVEKFSKQYEHNLFKIMPTSAAITKIMPTVEEAKLLHDMLHEWFPSEKVFKMAISSMSAFCNPRLPLCTVPVEQRKDLIEKYSHKDLPWSVFALIAREIYATDDLEKSIERLKEISGIEPLRELINEHFFKRSRLLRCNTVLNELRRILLEILFSHVLLQAEQMALNKQKMIDACSNIPGDCRTLIVDLIEKNIDSLEKVQVVKSQVDSQRGVIDTLLSALSVINNAYIDFWRIMEHPEEFSDEEKNELSNLFAGQLADINLQQKHTYWSRVYQTSAPNSNRKKVAGTAKSMYAKKLMNI